MWCVLSHIEQEPCGLVAEVRAQQGQLLEHRVVDELVGQRAATTLTVPWPDNRRVATGSFDVGGDFLRGTRGQLGLTLPLLLGQPIGCVTAPSHQLVPKTYTQRMAGSGVSHDECGFPFADRLRDGPYVRAGDPVVKQACNNR